MELERDVHGFMLMDLTRLALAWVICSACAASAYSDRPRYRGAGDDPSEGNLIATGAAESCRTDGPAYLHGDLWVHWHNWRVKCDEQHRNVWRCEKRGRAFGFDQNRIEAECQSLREQFDRCIYHPEKSEEGGICTTLGSGQSYD